MQTDNFFSVPRESVNTSAGVVELPILYHRLELLLAFFLVDAVASAELLPGKLCQPVRLPFQKSVAGLAFYRYDETSVGSYNEVGLALAALPAEVTSSPFSLLDLFRPAVDRNLGFYIVDLPVTTERANAAGREIWGYPKFVTDLPLLFGSQFYGEVKDPQGKNICTLEGPLRQGISLPAFDLVTYTQLGDQRIRTHVDVRGQFSYAMGDMVLHLGESTHGMAEHLRQLNLSGARPFLVAHSTNWQSRLNKGNNS